MVPLPLVSGAHRNGAIAETVELLHNRSRAAGSAFARFASDALDSEDRYYHIRRACFLGKESSIEDVLGRSSDDAIGTDVSKELRWALATEQNRKQAHNRNRGLPGLALPARTRYPKPLGISEFSCRMPVELPDGGSMQEL